MAGDERGLFVNNLVHTKVSVEVGFDGLEDGNRTISASAATKEH